jgi:predicted RNase H-like HicB family nuclease
MSPDSQRRKYLVVVEQAGDGSFSAYVPDLPGCASCAETMEELRASIREAIELHIEGLREEGLEVPEPHSTGDYVLAAI